MSFMVEKPARTAFLIEVDRNQSTKMQKNIDQCLYKSLSCRRTAGKIDNRQSAFASEFLAEIVIETFSGDRASVRSRNSSPGGTAPNRNHCLCFEHKPVDPGAD